MLLTWVGAGALSCFHHRSISSVLKSSLVWFFTSKQGNWQPQLV